jgi:hypothetical protein
MMICINIFPAKNGERYVTLLRGRETMRPLRVVLFISHCLLSFVHFCFSAESSDLLSLSLSLSLSLIFARRKAGAMLRVALISSWIVELASPLLRTTRTHRFLGAYLLLCYFVPELSSISDFLFGKKYHLSADMTFIRFSHRRTSDSDTRLNKRVV